MKNETLANDHQKGQCGKSACITCPHCRAVNFEEHRPEIRIASEQLYAKEVENYFFHYALRITQIQ